MNTNMKDVQGVESTHSLGRNREISVGGGAEGATADKKAASSQDSPPGQGEKLHWVESKYMWGPG